MNTMKLVSWLVVLAVMVLPGCKREKSPEQDRVFAAPDWSHTIYREGSCDEYSVDSDKYVSGWSGVPLCPDQRIIRPASANPDSDGDGHISKVESLLAEPDWSQWSSLGRTKVKGHPAILCTEPDANGNHQIWRWNKESSSDGVRYWLEDLTPEVESKSRINFYESTADCILAQQKGKKD